SSGKWHVKASELSIRRISSRSCRKVIRSRLCVRQGRNIESVENWLEEFYMSLVWLNIMYGHLEGTEGKFARDPSGYLSIEAGIYQKHGLEVSWDHVQRKEERYRRLGKGTAQNCVDLGRSSL